MSLRPNLRQRQRRSFHAEKKSLLIPYEGMGKDIRDPDVFDEIVEKARQDLGEKNKK